MQRAARIGAWRGKALPYDAEVEYLESTGTQWIVLPYNSSEYSTKLKTVIEYQLTRTDRRQLSGSNSSYVEHCSISGNVGNSTIPADLNKHTLVMNGYGTPRTTFDGVELAFSGFVRSTDLSYQFTIGNLKTDSVSGRCYWKLYAVKVENNAGKLITDLIPVRVGTVGYFYDRVSGQLFGNSGTGAFVIGPDKTT